MAGPSRLTSSWRDSKLGDASPVFDLKAVDFTGLLRTAARD
jgi:hypothetical protein